MSRRTNNARSWARTLLAAFIFTAGAGAARAQFQVPEVIAPPAPAELFANQCGVCHSLNPSDPPRQGPVLKGVVGRRAGTLPGFKYSAGFAKADFSWDQDHLNRWLTDPQALIPGSVMLYKQADPKIRAAIIQFLGTQQ